uniref:HAT C-terminal dimerisation domain-containing protein n=1 Tax=Leersia perrieri TaxID=77586 RepID=A0A0D9X7D5_9ORYZ
MDEVLPVASPQPSIPKRKRAKNSLHSKNPRTVQDQIPPQALMYTNQPHGNHLQMLHQTFLVQPKSKEYCSSNVELPSAQVGSQQKGHGMFSDYNLYVKVVAHMIQSHNWIFIWMNQLEWPELSRMACDVLVVHVSSVASESTFSESHRVITFNRSSLKSKTVDALISLHD